MPGPLEVWAVSRTSSEPPLDRVEGRARRAPGPRPSAKAIVSAGSRRSASATQWFMTSLKRRGRRRRPSPRVMVLLATAPKSGASCSSAARGTGGQDDELAVLGRALGCRAPAASTSVRPVAPRPGAARPSVPANPGPSRPATNSVPSPAAGRGLGQWTSSTASPSVSNRDDDVQRPVHRPPRGPRRHGAAGVPSALAPSQRSGSRTVMSVPRPARGGAPIRARP